MLNLVTYTVLWTYVNASGGTTTISVPVNQTAPHCWSSNVFAVNDFKDIPGDALARSKVGPTYHQIQFGLWNHWEFAESLVHVGTTGQPCVFHRYSRRAIMHPLDTYWVLAQPANPGVFAPAHFEFRRVWPEVIDYRSDVYFEVN